MNSYWKCIRNSKKRTLHSTLCNVKIRIPCYSYDNTIHWKPYMSLNSFWKINALTAESLLVIESLSYWLLILNVTFHFSIQKVFMLEVSKGLLRRVDHILSHEILIKTNVLLEMSFSSMQRARGIFIPSYQR